MKDKRPPFPRSQVALGNAIVGGAQLLSDTGNEVALTPAFPSANWERGKVKWGALISLLMILLASLAVRADETLPSLSVGGLVVWSQVPLTDKDIGKTVSLETNLQGYAGQGTLPPKGMIAFSKQGNLYHGRVDSFTTSSVTISAPAGSKDDPTFRVRITIGRERILKMEYALQ